VQKAALGSKVLRLNKEKGCLVPPPLHYSAIKEWTLRFTLFLSYCPVSFYPRRYYPCFFLNHNRYHVCLLFHPRSKHARFSFIFFISYKYGFDHFLSFG